MHMWAVFACICVLTAVTKRSFLTQGSGGLDAVGFAPHLSADSERHIGNKLHKLGAGRGTVSES